MSDLLERVKQEQSRRLAEAARSTFASFIKASWPLMEQGMPLSWSWHHDAICEHMEALFKGQITRLVIALPPRHTKSTIVSVAFPAWVWINTPYERFLTASYRLDLAIRDTERSRLLMESDWYQTHYGDSFKFSAAQNVKSWYRNNQGGTRIATSVQGGATGEGGMYVVCLDSQAKIRTERGLLSIGEIVAHKYPIRVVSYNHTEKYLEYKPILRWYETPCKSDMVKITCTNGASLTCTTNHPIYSTSQGLYVEAGQLLRGELLYKTVVESVKPVSRPEYVYNLEIEDNNNYFSQGILCHNCDDPHNIMDVESKVQREAVHKWWDSVMGNRLNDQLTGRMAIIAQRSHKHDLTGHVLDQGGYEYLMLPAEYDPARHTHTKIGWDDPRTLEGDPLWPEKFPKEVLERRKAVMQAQYFSQYQQAPISEDGSIIKSSHMRAYHLMHPHLSNTHSEQVYILMVDDLEVPVKSSVCRLVISSDYAVSKKQRSDFSVFLLWALTPDYNALLLDATILKVTGPEAEDEGASWAKRYHERLFGIIVEDVAYQKSIIQRLQRDGIPVIPYHPQGDKVSRAHAIAVYFKAGQFYFPSIGTPVMADVVRQLLEFPGEEHDDVMDATSILLAIYQGKVPRIRSTKITPETVVAAKKLREEQPELWKFLQEEQQTDGTINQY